MFPGKVSRQGFTLNKVPLPNPTRLSFTPTIHQLPLRTYFCMARKGAATTTDAGEPRRSSRIKDQAKPELPPKKAVAKPRAKPRSRKHHTAERGDVTDKEAAKSGDNDGGNTVPPKSEPSSKKRTASEKDIEGTQPALNGEDCPPPAKKVHFRSYVGIPKLIAHAGQTRFSGGIQVCHQSYHQTPFQGCHQANV